MSHQVIATGQTGQTARQSTRVIQPRRFESRRQRTYFPRPHRPLSGETSYESSLGAITAALKARDPYTWNHSMRVSEYAGMIARQLDLAPTQVSQIETAGRLHDIGKIGVPDGLLHKPGPLTSMEYTRVMEHPLIGSRILSHLLPNNDPILIAVRSHHEWVNGSGGPDGLSGDRIPLAARILAVADAFDAMTSARPYRAPLPCSAAFAELERCVGTQFDSLCVDALREAISADTPPNTLVAVPA